MKPLAKFPIIVTDRVEEAEYAISRSLTDVSIIRAAERNRFNLQMNGVDIGSTSLLFNRFETETKIHAGLDGDFVLFIFAGNAPIKIILDEGSVVASPKKAALVMPGKLRQIERTKGSEAFVLRTPLSELLHHFEELIAWHHRGSLIFDYSIDLTKGPGAMLRQMVNHLHYELGHNATVLKDLVRLKSYDEMLLSALLSLPHNQSKKLFEDRRYQIAPGIVRRAEEYMRAHIEEPVSITGLLHVSGCSRRVLFSAFRNSRGYTPMEFLTEQRLQSARQELLKSDKGASVATIALGCGLKHLGRFSQVYRKRFGEKPSDTKQKKS